ncbi:MAG: protease inhibitor I42 family protein [Smithellaceae bacterium]|nr:protease inhibitor I42 family protein [Smithellaceae bacterium]
MKKVLIISCVLLLWIGCVQSKVFRGEDSGKAFSIATGQSFRIELPSNPSTGFDWHVDVLDQNNFKVVNSDYNPSAKKLIGAGGTRWWEIKAVKRGKANIRLLYYRVWEGKGKASDKYEIEIAVNGEPVNILSLKTKEKADDYLLEIVYPEVKGLDSDIRQSINRQIKAVIDEKKTTFLKGKNKPFGSFKNSISGQYEVIGITDNYLSIIYRTEVMYAGAAHPQHWLNVLNFDLNNGGNLTLPQLFEPGAEYLNFISDYCEKELLGRPELARDKDWVGKGTAPTLANYKIFNLSDKELIITFPEYQVGPYAVGEQAVKISYDKLTRMTVKLN